MSAVNPSPVYFETSWSILSTIGIVNVLIGTVVVGITSFSSITLVPIVVSAAGALADGFCYFAFYADYPTTPTAIAAGISDVCWLIQEAGLSFYSYYILNRILHSRERKVFLYLFWILILTVTTLRILILVCRVKDILEDSLSRVVLIDRLHIGYFINIALLEILSSYFLLRKFFIAKKSLTQTESTSGIRYLLRSTEVRLAGLTLIGITRSITYSFQTTAQSATSVSGQVDRFVVTLECLFPIVMFIDILATKTLMARTQTQGTSVCSRGGRDGLGSLVVDMKTPGGDWSGAGQGVYAMTNIETRVDARGDVSSSQERIVGAAPVGTGHHHSNSLDGDIKGGGIHKTVEFVFHDSESPA